MDIWTSKQISQDLGISRKTVQRWLELEILHGEKKSNRVGYSISDEEYLRFLGEHPKYELAHEYNERSRGLNNKTALSVLEVLERDILELKMEPAMNRYQTGYNAALTEVLGIVQNMKNGAAS